MNKVAIVFGTSSGLGLAAASSLLERGFSVFGGSRGESPIQHENFFDIEVDITQESSIKSFFKEVNSETEVCDILINAAGVCEMSSFEDTESLDMRIHLETNVIGYFNILKSFEPFIITEETHVISLFSISAKSYFENTLAYSTSEFAKKALINTLKKEWRKYDIRFSNMYIGAVKTPLWDGYDELESEVDKMLTTEDFRYVLDSLINSPTNIQFPELTFLHRDGFIS